MAVRGAGRVSAFLGCAHHRQHTGGHEPVQQRIFGRTCRHGALSVISAVGRHLKPVILEEEFIDIFSENKPIAMTEEFLPEKELTDDPQ
jgi:hypothetical protein